MLISGFKRGTTLQNDTVYYNMSVGRCKALGCIQAKMADCHNDRTPYKVNDVQLMLHLITVFFYRDNKLLFNIVAYSYTSPIYH